MSVSSGSLPPAEKLTSWSHQRTARRFAQERWTNGFPGVLLAMWMGTGKTKTAIDLAASLSPTRLLVVCPMRIVAVWELQLKLHAPFPYRLAALDDRVGSVAAKARAARDTLALARAEGRVAVIVINYESACFEPFASWALANYWPLIIADEIHRIKSNSGKQSRFMGRLAVRAARRLGLTGTPLPHSLLDAWAQFRFLDARVFDETFHSYKTRYALFGGFHNKQIKGFREVEDFNRRFYSITYRVTKEEALPDLPPQIDQLLECELSPRGAQIYRELEANFITWLGDAPEEELTVPNAMVLLLRLQQVTGGTLKDDSGQEHAVDDSKEELLTDWLSDLDPEEPVVVFARFHSDLDAIRRACQKAERSSGELSGRSQEGFAGWKEGKVSVLATQIQVGSEGQDFTRARYCVFYSMGFSLSQYQQARDRLHRPGQTRSVFYYHLLVRNTIDRRVLRAVENRSKIVETILQEMRPHASKSV